MSSSTPPLSDSHLQKYVGAHYKEVTKHLEDIGKCYSLLQILITRYVFNQFFKVILCISVVVDHVRLVVCHVLP